MSQAVESLIHIESVDNVVYLIDVECSSMMIDQQCRVTNDVLYCSILLDNDTACRSSTSISDLCSLIASHVMLKSKRLEPCRNP